jgi:aminoglycoside 6'-N-acetyltransferase I
MAMPVVRPVKRTDAESWLRLRRQLWPDGSELEHRREIEAFLDGHASEPAAVLVADKHGALVGLVELSIRPSAEGCRTNRVAYLEGWFVVSEERRKGFGGALVRAAENWARDAGCIEFASDTPPTNIAAIHAHAGVGFESAGSLMCFRKSLYCRPMFDGAWRDQLAPQIWHLRCGRDSTGPADHRRLRPCNPRRQAQSTGSGCHRLGAVVPHIGSNATTAATVTDRGRYCRQEGSERVT